MLIAWSSPRVQQTSRHRNMLIALYIQIIGVSHPRLTAAVMFLKNTSVNQTKALWETETSLNYSDCYHSQSLIKSFKESI
jgi:hypothetical protein